MATLWLVASTLTFADTAVSSCGQTLAKAGERYYLTQDLSSAGECLNIKAQNVELDGAGHKITFRNVGVRLTGRVDGTRVHGITFQNTSNAPTNAAAIRSQTGLWNDVIIENNTFFVTNSSVEVVYGIYKTNGVGQGTHIRNNTFEATGSKRMGIVKVGWGSGGGFVHGNTVDYRGTSCYGRPLIFSNDSGTAVEIFNNQITNGEPSSVGRPCLTQGITFWLGENHKVYGNTVTDFGGHSRLIHFDHAKNVEVYENTIFQRGSDNDGANQAVRLRYSTDGADVYDNVIDGSDCRGRQCYQISMGSLGDSYNPDRPKNLRVYGNRLIGKEQIVRVFEGAGPSIEIYDNTIELISGGSDRWPILIWEWDQNIFDVAIMNNTFVGTHPDNTWIRFNDQVNRPVHPSGPTELCGNTVNGVDLTAEHISDIGQNDWTITQAPCDLGSGGGGGGGTNEPPQNVRNQRRNDIR